MRRALGLLFSLLLPIAQLAAAHGAPQASAMECEAGMEHGEGHGSLPGSHHPVDRCDCGRLCCVVAPLVAVHAGPALRIATAEPRRIAAAPLPRTPDVPTPRFLLPYAIAPPAAV